MKREPSSPPRPHLVVRIGAIGHRPNRLASAMAQHVEGLCRQVISAIKESVARAYDAEVYSEKIPLIRVISSLAEGADRIVAEIGLELGAELQCPLPFSAAEFERDFSSDDSREQFHALLAKASAVLEQDGCRAAQDAAYESAGRTVIHQSDVVIAIWDGDDAAGRGGTAQMVKEAVALGVPVVWIHAQQRVPACVLSRDDRGRSMEELVERLPALLGLRCGFSGAGCVLARGYYAERQPLIDVGQLFRMFRDLVARMRLPLRGWLVADFETSARREWEAALACTEDFPKAARDYILQKVGPHFAWADGLSKYYAGCLRSSSLVVNLLGATAVAMALVGLLFLDFGRELGKVPVLLELLAILVILTITLYGRRRKWHEKWLNYRQLAEQLRQISFLAPLGCAIPSPHLPAHLGDDPQSPWITGVARAIERDMGLVHARVDATYLAAMTSWLSRFVGEQIEYHDQNADTAARFDHHLHRISTWLFVGTLLVCVAHLLSNERHWMLFAAAVFPALGAAFYSISNQGELARIAKRSRAMKRELVAMEAELLTVQATGKMDMERVRTVARQVADVMIAETVDWLFVFRLRSLTLPG